MIAVRRNGPSPDLVPVQCALLSTYDKTDLVPFARALHQLQIKLVSSGGTAHHLREKGVPVQDVSAVTGFPEILGGRVKTLHPGIHGAVLFRRGDAGDEAELESLGIGPIDMVVVNLYPFEAAVAQPKVTDAVAAEHIDIGGPALVRAAAKNFAFVTAVSSPGDYQDVLDSLRQHRGALPLRVRRRLARAAFERTATYDRAIAAYLAGHGGPMPATYEERRPMDRMLRYGENPHQAAAFYGDLSSAVRQHHGKALSYNNLIDTGAALALIAEFEDAPCTVAILKHTNPCGVATARTLLTAYERAFATDMQSPFGGIVVMNRTCTLAVAEAINRVFTEVIIAPGYAPDALDFLRSKRNRRLLQALQPVRPSLEARHLLSGVLCQERDAVLASDLLQAARCVTRRAPNEEEARDLDFAWRVAKHVKSNAIVYARERRTLGIGAGQMSRVDASEIAVAKAAKAGHSLSGSVVASDAFFPFADGLEAAADAGAGAAIQPGGSVRDREVIQAADARKMAMIFTGTRHFRH